MESQDTILGRGIYGYASIGGQVLALLASNVDAAENLHRSPSCLSNSVASSTGEVPHRNRQQLSAGLVCELNEASINLLHQTTFDWRNNNQITSYFPSVIIPANGEGYDCPETYIESVTLNVTEGSIGTISFQLNAWRWSILPGTSTPRSQKAATFYNNSLYQPIPQWDTQLINSGMTGTALSFTLKFNNQWQFKHLMESTTLPPTPRVVFAGKLLVDLQMEVLAGINSPPAESGEVSVYLAGGNPGMITTTQTRIKIPLMYRHPQRSYQGLGDPNGLIKWSSSWYALGAAPYLF